MLIKRVLVALLIINGFILTANDNSNKAILVVEFQKTWTERSFYYNLVKEEYESRNVYENTLNLLETARANDITVIQAPLILDKSDKKAYKKIPILPKIFRQFTANTWRAEFTDGILDDTDLIVSGRTAFDATVDSNLIDLLKKNNIDKIYIVGFTTDHCVKDTINGLKSYGYDCILVSDCTAARSRKGQIKIESKYPNMKHTQVISQILSTN